MIFGCAALLAGPRPARAAGVEEQVSKLLAEAVAAPAYDAAEKKLAEAEQLLKRRRHQLDKFAHACLQAELRRTRGRVALLAWQRDPAQAQRRQQGRRILLRLLDEFDRLQEEGLAEIDRLEKRLGDKDPSKNRAWRGLNGYVARINYATAWTHRDLGRAVQDAAGRKAHLEKAVEAFADFTGDEWSGNPIVIDCFLGQAVCLHELGRHAEVVELLKPHAARIAGAAAGSKALAFRQLLAVLVKALQQQNAHLDAEEALERYFNGRPADQPLDAFDLALALDRARGLQRLSDPAANPQHHAALAKRLDALARRVYAHGDPWRMRMAKLLGKAGPGTVFGWMDQSRTHFDAKRYREAFESATKALAAAGNDEHGSLLLPDLRYMRLASAWNGEKWREAFDAGSEFLQHHRADRRAGDVCDRTLRAGMKALEAVDVTTRPGTAAVRAMLNFGEKHFPKLPEVGKVPWHRANLLLMDGEYAQAEELLKQVGSDSPVYRNALYGLALATYKQAEALAELPSPNETQLVILLTKLASVVERFAAAAPDPWPSAQRPLAQGTTQVALAGARLWLSRPKPDTAAVLALLGRLDTMKGVIGEAAAGQLRTLRVEANLRAGKIEDVARFVEDLLAGGDEAKARYRVFAAVADPLEKQRERLAAERDADGVARLDTLLLRLYEALAAYARDAKDLQQQVAVRRRLGHALQRLGRHADAIEHYEWARPHVPVAEAGGLLKRLAIAYEHANRHRDALPLWRMLAKGLKERSEDWYEAYYHLIRGYARTNRKDRARRTLRLLKLRYPAIRSRSWRKKYNRLAEELEEDLRF